MNASEMAYAYVNTWLASYWTISIYKIIEEISQRAIIETISYLKEKKIGNCIGKVIRNNLTGWMQMASLLSDAKRPHKPTKINRYIHANKNIRTKRNVYI